MGKLLFSALLVATSATAQAQPAPAAAAIHPAVDTVQERQALRKLTICIAEQRPRWARSMLSYPYLSDAQASAAAEITKGNDHCLNAPEIQVSFRTSGVVSAAAEHFVRMDMPKADLKQLGSALATIAPLNVSEDFGLCLAARNPQASMDLALSDPGSADEAKAAGLVAASVPTCTKPTERLDVDLQALRALVATALYRGVTASSN
jgi:hypothetical protein